MYREPNGIRVAREAKATEFLASQSFQEMFFTAVDAGLKGAKYTIIEMLPVDVSGTKAFQDFRAAARATGIYDVVDFNLDKDRLGIEVQFEPRPFLTPLKNLGFAGGWFEPVNLRPSHEGSWDTIKDTFDFASAREEKTRKFLESNEFLDQFDAAIEDAIKRKKRSVKLFDLRFDVEGTRTFAQFREAVRAEGIHDVVPFKTGVYNHYFGLEIQLSPQPLYALAMKLHLVN